MGYGNHPISQILVKEIESLTTQLVKNCYGNDGEPIFSVSN